MEDDDTFGPSRTRDQSAEVRNMGSQKKFPMTEKKKWKEKHLAEKRNEQQQKTNNKKKNQINVTFGSTVVN